MRVIIIDDEQPARDLLKVYLKEYAAIQIVAEASNGFEAAKLVNELKPELIFLDIQMPKIDGFEMLELLEEVPQVIFCTAFDQYALKAFDKNAVDYLLKPFSKSRFAEALEKVSLNQQTRQSVKLPQVADYQQPLERVVIRDRKEIIIIDVADIDFLEAQDDYVEIHTPIGHWLKQKTMKYFEESLDDRKFCRVHRKYLIRLDRLNKIDKLGKETYTAVLKNGKNIPVSQTGYTRLRELLDI